MIASVRGSLTRKRLRPARARDGDAAAHRLDVAAHHVEPDAAPGDVRDGARGAEARLEDQPFEPFGREPLAFSDEPARDRALANPRVVEARAVVGDLDHDAAS